MDVFFSTLDVSLGISSSLVNIRQSKSGSSRENDSGAFPMFGIFCDVGKVGVFCGISRAALNSGKSSP